MKPTKANATPARERNGWGLRILAACAATAVACGAATASAGAGPALTYSGGPIMPSVTTELVLWGADVNPTYASTDANLLSDLAAASGATDNVFSILSEYSTPTQTLR